jgi:16S rRNA (adenine1518-N6/adenine1519-N6)-dimethyltransferase
MNPKYLLDVFDIAPKKSLGQNFLHDPSALEKIVSVAELMPEDTVLEVGPGTGTLTVALAQSVVRVIAVEIDGRLLPVLQRTLGDFPNVEVIHADILETDVEALVGPEDYSVVANLPYYITSAVMRHLLKVRHKPQRLILTMQEEVAERLVAKPGDMSLLSVGIQFYGKARIAARLGQGAFWPRPDVSSAVVRIDVAERPQVEVPNEAEFFRVVRAGFGQKRKQLRNSLGAGLGLSHPESAAMLEKAGIDPARRAETLSIHEWAALTRIVAAQGVQHANVN